MVRISDAEYEVMKIVWAKKETTSLEIIAELKNGKWNANTIRTLITRLEKKGAIQISGRDGKSYKYITTIDENEYKREVTRDLLKRLYHNSIEEFVLDYYKDGKLSCAEIKEVIDYIEKREAEREKKHEEE